MAKVLRKEIIEDKGHGTLKYKTLDLISKLRLESQLLNDAKNGPNKNRPQIKPLRINEEKEKLPA